jgi:adenylate cyclase
MKKTLSQSERRLAAIMFTDMVGYTALGQKNESLSLALVEEQRNLLRPVLAKHQGREVKTIGDAFLVEFASAVGAVRCAYDAQRSVKEFNMALPSDKRIHIRVGIHLGEVSGKDGDILGDAVNVASRIESLAEDGGVCLTQQVYDHVHNKLDVQLVSLGKKSLKNVSEPIEVYRMLMPWKDEKSTLSTPPDKRRIAVLPFANISQDSNDEYFADGMTEELITAMSGLQGLQVIARTSVMNYKGGGTKLSTIASELGVGTVLEGSVRKAGNKVRVTAQLIDVPTESHLWSEKYDRELDDIFKIQDDIAGKIAQALKVHLTPVQESGRKHTENMEAYTCYLRGRFLWNKRSREGVLEAMNAFREAIKIDPEYARAYSGLADAYTIAVNYDFMDGAEGQSKALEAATRALKLDDGLPEAHASIGLIMMSDMKYLEARNELQRAIQLNPSYASAHHFYSNCLLELGNLNEAVEEIKRARELDPLSPVIELALAQQYALAGRLDESLSMLDKLLEREPSFASGYLGRAICYWLKDMKDKAFDDVKSHHNLSKDDEYYKLTTAWLHGWFGDRKKALNLIDEVLRESGDRPKDLGWVAGCYAVLGERDEFFKWVDRAISMKSFTVLWLRYTPACDKVRSDPRFPEIFKKLGLPY